MSFNVVNEEIINGKKGAKLNILSSKAYLRKLQTLYNNLYIVVV